MVTGTFSVCYCLHMSTNTVTAATIAAAAPKTSSGRKAAEWLTDLLAAHGSAHLARVIRGGIARPPALDAPQFELDVYAIYCRLTHREAARRPAYSPEAAYVAEYRPY